MGEEKQKIKEFMNEKYNKNIDYYKNLLSEKLEEFKDYDDVTIINPIKFVHYIECALKKAELIEIYNVNGFFTITREDKPTIFYDKNLDISKLRYVLMHEAAHKLILDDMRLELEKKFKTNLQGMVFDLVAANGEIETEDNEIENACNEFASEALMPQNSFTNYYLNLMQEYSFEDRVQKCAEYFGAEEKLVKERIEELKL